jgi:hypothetical protein
MSTYVLPAATLANPYWDAVRDHVDPTGSLWGTPTVDGLGRYRTPDGRIDLARWNQEALKRHDFTARYAWTITDPATVDFVIRHAGPRLVDPLAGTGYWAWLLSQAGVDVVAYDQHPPTVDSESNRWHRNVAAHCPVMQGDAVDTVTVHGDRTLLLAWPPCASPLGADVLRAYAGPRVIYIGEGQFGCCGDDAMFDLLARDWVEVADHVPVQWDGLHDVVRVYHRAEVTP